MMDAHDNARHERQRRDQINSAGHAAELQRRERKRREGDDIAERHEHDARHREDENEP
jgi:hypothetical protein